MASQKRGEQTRAHILQAASECFIEYGSDTTGAGDLPLRWRDRGDVLYCESPACGVCRGLSHGLGRASAG